MARAWWSDFAVNIRVVWSFFETLHFCIPQYCTQVTLINLAIVYTFEGGLLSLLKFARINCLFVFVHGWLKKIAILNSEITF